jgi:hypothetical protein
LTTWTDVGEEGGEGDERGRCACTTTWTDVVKACSEGDREDAAEYCEGMGAGEADGEGDECRQYATTWSGAGEAGGEGEHDVAENCEEMGGEGRNAGAVDGEDGGEGDDWERGATTWADVGEAG